MTLADLRRFGLSLPRTTEASHHELGSLRVDGKIFATWPAEGSRVHIFVSAARAMALAAEHPQACTLLMWGAKVAGIRVELPTADGALLERWVEEAWALKAPKRVLALWRVQC